jgi:AmmeMemoRadiSam system protein A
MSSAKANKQRMAAILSLGPNDRAMLSDLAREAIRSAVAGSPEPSLQDVPPALQARAGVFVTLYRHGQLRGCVGTLRDDEPLHVAVRRIAQAAALQDGRFDPVGRQEVDELEIEISVLSPLKPVARPEEIVVGEHGVVLECDGYRGVFLPKVAVEQGWSREMLLDQLCLKAGLPRGAWQDPSARLYVFTVESWKNGADHGR